jgi:hypothetical protein
MYGAQKMRRKKIEIEMHYKERNVFLQQNLNPRMAIKRERREYSQEDINYDYFLKRCQNMVKSNSSTLTPTNMKSLLSVSPQN